MKGVKNTLCIVMSVFIASSIAISDCKSAHTIINRYYNGSVVHALYSNPSNVIVTQSSCNNISNRQSVKNIVKKENAVAGINASFFDTTTGHPFGVLIINGKIKNYNIYNRPSLIIKNDYTVYISNLNPRIEQIKDIKYAVGGGSSLIREGKIFVTREHFSKYFILAKLTRTAIGHTSDNRIVLAVVTNCDLFKLAKIMKNLGCIAAINLDGGGSSQMIIYNKSLTKSYRQVPVAIIVK